MELKLSCMMNDNLIGCYLKTIRIYNECSKVDVAQTCNLSLQFLSQLEDSVSYVSVSRETQGAILKMFNQRLTYDQQLENELSASLDEFYHDCIFGDEKSAKQVFSKLLSKEERIKELILFPEYLLGKYIYLVLYDSNNVELEVLHSLLDKISHHFNNKNLRLYWTYLGVYHVIKGDLLKGRERLLFALSIGYDELLTGLIFYDLVIVENRLGNHIQAYEYSMKANSFFDKTNNYLRKAQNLTHIGIICEVLKEYTNAKQYCISAIELAEKLHDNFILSANYQNLSWISLLTKEYDQTVEYVNKATKYYNSNYVYHFHNAFAYMKLEQIEQSNHWAHKGLEKIVVKNKVTDHDYRLCKLVLDLNATKNKEKVLEKFIVHAEKSMHYDRDVMMLIYRELIDLKRKNGNLESAFEWTDRFHACHGK